MLLTAETQSAKHVWLRSSVECPLRFPLSQSPMARSSLLTVGISRLHLFISNANHKNIVASRIWPSRGWSRADHELLFHNPIREVEGSRACTPWWTAMACPFFPCRPATFEDGVVEATYRGENWARRNSCGVVPYQRLNARWNEAGSE
jgi:hypothetical protein